MRYIECPAARILQRRFGLTLPVISNLNFSLQFSLICCYFRPEECLYTRSLSDALVLADIIKHIYYSVSLGFASTILSREVCSHPSYHSMNIFSAISLAE